MEKIGQEPVIFLFRKMWRFAKGHRRWIALYLLMSAAANMVILTQPLVFREFLNEIQFSGFGDHNIVSLVLTLSLLLVIEFGFWAFHGPSRVIENIMAFRTEQQYRQYLLSGVLSLGLSWHSIRDSGDTIDKIEKSANGLFRFASHTFLVLEVLIKAIGTTIILLFFNPFIGAIALALLTVGLFTIFQFDIRLIPQYKALNIFDNKVSARVFDSLSNITTVKVLNIEKPIFRGIRSALWAPFELFRKNKILVEAKWFTGSLVFTLIIVIPLLVYTLFLYRNNVVVEIGTLSALYLYLSNLLSIYFNFAGSYEEMIVNKARIANADEIDTAIQATTRARKKPSPHWNTLALQRVSFSYTDVGNTIPHIDSVSLQLTHGERVALIGESGSGKTTFLKVIHGLYPDASGEIAFDDSIAHKTNFSDIALNTTLVPQEPEVFSSSIRENITLGVEYSEEEIRHATDLAQFTSVIEHLPRGLESVINEKGVNLSGGQKQRLALSRALLFSADKHIILLDESTSSVDPETEVKIYANIFEYFKGRTIIASIHKMNLLKYFDKIVIFKDGKNVDQGTFDDLLARNKKFKRDWEEYVAEQKR